MEISDEKIQKVKACAKDTFQNRIKVTGYCSEHRELVILALLGIVTPEEVKQWEIEAKLTGINFNR